jgi:hypothetical protein
VTAALATHGELPLARLVLTAKANILTISGKVRSNEVRDQIRATAERVIGEAALSFQVTIA